MPVFLVSALAWLRASPAAVAVIIAVVVAGVVITTGTMATRSIMETVRQARDGHWLKTLGKANDDAIEESRRKAKEARDAVEAARAAAESETAARARVIELEAHIRALSDNPVCIPKEIVLELIK